MAKKGSMAKVFELGKKLVVVRKKIHDKEFGIRVLSNKSVLEKTVEKSKSPKNRITWNKLWNRKFWVSEVIGVASFGYLGGFFLGPIGALGGTIGGLGSGFTGKNSPKYLGGALVRVTSKRNSTPVPIPRKAVGKKEEISKVFSKEVKKLKSERKNLITKHKKIRLALEKESKLIPGLSEKDQRKRMEFLENDSAYNKLMKNIYGEEVPKNIGVILNSVPLQMGPNEISTDKRIKLDNAYSDYWKTLEQNHKFSNSQVLAKVSAKHLLSKEDGKLLMSAIQYNPGVGGAHTILGMKTDVKIQFDPDSGNIQIDTTQKLGDRVTSAMPGSEAHELTHEMDLMLGEGIEMEIIQGGELKIKQIEQVIPIPTLKPIISWTSEFVAQVVGYLHNSSLTSEKDAYKKVKKNMKTAKFFETPCIIKKTKSEYQGIPIAVALIQKHREKKNWFDLILKDTKKIMNEPRTANLETIYKKYGLKAVVFKNRVIISMREKAQKERDKKAKEEWKIMQKT